MLIKVVYKPKRGRFKAKMSHLSACHMINVTVLVKSETTFDITGVRIRLFQDKRIAKAPIRILPLGTINFVSDVWNLYRHKSHPQIRAESSI